MRSFQLYLLPTSILILSLNWMSTVLNGQDQSKLEQPKRCEVVPLANHEVSFQIEGSEKLRWHFGDKYPRPFFFPFNGPTGSSLTRMGHPGAPNHDHHQSLWFAHHDVGGKDFWSNQRGNQIRQKQWIAYHDGDEEAIMAVSVGWFDSEKKEILDQEIIASLHPLKNNEHVLEIQATFRTTSKTDSTLLGKTNFGFMAIRVAKTLSAHFGGGKITNSEGQVDEKNIFGKRARWMDYSGPVNVGRGNQRKSVIEGITCFDHPSNPRYPTHWHVREDGWMGASFCFAEGFTIEPQKPLVLRYLLHAHSGTYNQAKAQAIHDEFAARSGFEVIKSSKRHQQFEVRRLPSK